MKSSGRYATIVLVTCNLLFIAVTARIVWYYHFSWDLSAPKIKVLLEKNPDEYLRGRQPINDEFDDLLYYGYMPLSVLALSLSSLQLWKLHRQVGTARNQSERIEA